MTMVLSCLSDQPIPIAEAFDSDLFSTDHLMDDLEATVNGAELARRQFRDIAVIAGLVFRGFQASRCRTDTCKGRVACV